MGANSCTTKSAFDISGTLGQQCPSSAEKFLTSLEFDGHLHPSGTCITQARHDRPQYEENPLSAVEELVEQWDVGESGPPAMDGLAAMPDVLVEHPASHSGSLWDEGSVSGQCSGDDGESEIDSESASGQFDWESETCASG